MRADQSTEGISKFFLFFLYFSFFVVPPDVEIQIAREAYPQKIWDHQPLNNSQVQKT